MLSTRCPSGEWSDYERALRYNLSTDERTALVELLYILKGLHATLHASLGAPEGLLRRAIHELTQRFVHSTMGAPTRKAVKYERKALKAALMQLRNLCADWADEPSTLMDERLMVSKEFKYASHDDDYPARWVPPSQTQLFLLRATVRSLYDERSPHTKATLLQDAELSKETVRAMREFVSESVEFPYLLRLSSTLHALNDTGFLWMREFYLELCKRVQFPISMSVPALLVEHVHDSHTPFNQFQRGLRVREVNGRPGHIFGLVLRLDASE